MKRAMFLACALMTLILVFTACGSDATATAVPPQEISLTTVIVMAKANEIREIQVDGKNLTVYPKTVAKGGPDRFVSRIGDDTDIIGLLIDNGVEVGPPNGVEVTFKGESAKDVQATISAALAQAANRIVEDKILVTPTRSAASDEHKSIDGLWEGTTLYRDGNLTTMVNFSTGTEGLEGTLDLPQIGRKGLVVHPVIFD